MANEIPVITPDMRNVYLRLKRWRSSHPRRVPIAESLWAAGELARAHGINPTAKALHLKYGKRKRRAEACVPANAAEGNARGTKRDCTSFLSVAKGSLMETETFLMLAV